MGPRRKLTTALAIVAMLAMTFVGQVAAPERVAATPIATDASTYAQYQRVFPDPQGCRQGEPGTSPFAQGTVCATDFIQFDELVAGTEFLASVDPAEFPGLYPDGGRPFGEFVTLERLDEDYADVLDLDGGDGLSAGLPTTGGERERLPLYMIKVTDSASDIPEAEREHFTFSLGIHGIERAGVEGGVRAAEDLVTWGATDPDRPLVETDPARSVSVGEALRHSVVYFLLPNPDGWVRGDTSRNGVFYQRYNGNGIDLNRDWPAEGYTFRPYTPLSEPESRSFARVLQSIRSETTDDRFRGANDLHGQLIDRAFSFTLIGGNIRPFDKNDEAVDVMLRIWQDQETRLSWSPLIKPNTASPDDPRVYGDQWGSIWDTIQYTVTGALGDWLDSPLGLNATGLDNEMSLSHLINCGTGKCFDQQAEQLHVDGNKGLIYAQMNFQLREATQPVFRQPGRVAYVVNPFRRVNDGSSAPGQPEYEDLPPQEDITGTITHPPNSPLEFEVMGPDQGVYNGGFTVNVTAQNIQAVSTGMTGVIIEQRRADEDPPGEDEWTVVNSDYNQSPIYAQAGFTVNVNAPQPGTYRVRLDNPPPGQHGVEINFTTALSWPDPGQIPYDVSNMDFFTHMDEFAREGFGFTPVTVDEILDGEVDLDEFDTVVMADRFMPGWREELPPEPTGPPQEPIEGSVTSAAPGAGARSPATSVFFEFDVEPDANNETLRIDASFAAPGDYDLYLQFQKPDGSYTGDIGSGTSGSLSTEVLTLTERPEPGHYRLEVHNWAGPAGNQISLVVSFPEREIEPDEPDPLIYTVEERDAYLDLLADFGAGGGQLLFTDGGMEALRYLQAPDTAEPLFPSETDEDGDTTHQVRALTTYAGHVQFNDGEGPTYAEYDLAKDVNQPGAAEGPNNRHQTSDPVPTGFSIGDGFTSGTYPTWVVPQDAWEDAGGVTIGVAGEGRSQSSRGSDVSFGELPYGDGVVRVIGGLLPMPTESYDHPFGLSPYGVTWSGYQIFDNALQYVRPGGHWRTSGANRFETAVEVASAHWNTLDAVVIASGETFADALAAVPLAVALDAPILLTPQEGLDFHAYDWLLSRNPPPQRAYIIGGEAAVSEQVVDDLQRVYVPADGIVRLGGADRYETAVLVAEELAAVTETEPTSAVVATGERFPDALAAGPIASVYGPDQTPVPLLLVAHGFVPDVVATYLEEAGITETLVAGGDAAVSDEAAAELPEVTRAAGEHRYETAFLLAELLEDLLGEEITQATIATGDNFPDALVVGAPGGRDGIPTLLSFQDTLGPSHTLDWLTARADTLRVVYLAGGTAVLSEQVADEVDAITRR